MRIYRDSVLISRGHAVPLRVLGAVASVALATALAGCGGVPHISRSSPTPSSSTSPAAPTASGPASASPAPTSSIASKKVRLPGGGTVAFAVFSLQRRSDLTVLDFGVRNDGHGSFGVGRLLSRNGATYDVGGVYLDDTVHHMSYRPAISGGECVCSTGLDGFAVGPGEVQYLSATFAAPPADVHHVDIHLPSVGVLRDVPIGG